MTQNIIQCKLIQTARIIRITMGQAGNLTNHAALNNLDYDHAGHTGFQKKLNYVAEYRAYEIE